MLHLFKSPFVNEVASVFCLKHRYNLFGKKNTVYCVWVPHVFASETQGKGKVAKKKKSSKMLLLVHCSC